MQLKAGVDLSGHRSVFVIDRLIGWFGDNGPMAPGGGRHRRHLVHLRREAEENAGLVGAVLALSDADRSWLEKMGWQEPGFVRFVSLNRLESVICG